MYYINSLRGLAALVIVFFHIKHHLTFKIPFLSWIIENGFLSVDFFFILSGYILAYNYFRKFFIFNFQQYFHFLIKRFARIYPMHLAMLFAFLIIPLSHLITERSIDLERFSLYGFISKLLLLDAWGLGYEFTWNVPSWFNSALVPSLLGFPLFIYFISRLKPKALVPAFLITVCVLAFIYNYCGFDSIGDGIGKLAIFRCGFEFFLGIISFSIKKNFEIIKGNIAKYISYTSICLFVLFANFGVKNFFYVPIIFSIFILTFTSYSGVLHKFLNFRLFTFLGDISYSMYITHYFLRDFLTMTMLKNNQIASPFWICSYILIVILFSSVTYRYIELPSRFYLISKLIKKND